MGQIRRVAVLGCGVMGAGIAQVAAQAGFQVDAWDITQQALDRGRGEIRAFLEKATAKGKITASRRDTILGAITWSTTLDCVARADLVIEVVVENLQVKKELFTRLDGLAPGHAILASNTSVLPITELAAATKHPERVLGMHFFNPPPLMKLLEIVVGQLTSKGTLAAVKAFGEEIGKTTVTAKDAPGFIVNYLFIPYLNSALDLYDRGVASREDLDRAVEAGLGHPMGPLRLADLVGLDTHLLASEAIHRELGDARFVPPTILRRMVRAGLLGRKTGRGFYEYEATGGAGR
jgi:3-hydroxybutyryl-CoA dehydrogenase